MSQVLETLEFDGRNVAIRERLSEGPSSGVEVVTLEYAGAKCRVCPTRGMGILDINFHSENNFNSDNSTRVGWDSPVNGPVHPHLVNLESRNKLGWLDGFSELLVRCGLAYMGPPGEDAHAGPIVGDITLHGRIANTPSHSVEIGQDDNGVFVRGVVDETVLFGPRLKLTVETRITNEGEIRVTDIISNLGATATEYQLLYHINVGPPLLAEGSQIDIENLATVCPRDPRAAEDVDTWYQCLGPTPGYAEQAYFFATKPNATTTTASLIAPDGNAFRVQYDASELPCLTLWKCTQEIEGGYVIGLEPGTSYPNHKSFERNHDRVPTLAAGESVSKTLTLSLSKDTPRSDSSHEAQIMRVPDEPLAVRP